MLVQEGVQQTGLLQFASHLVDVGTLPGTLETALALAGGPDTRFSSYMLSELEGFLVYLDPAVQMRPLLQERFVGNLDDRFAGGVAVGDQQTRIPELLDDGRGGGIVFPRRERFAAARGRVIMADPDKSCEDAVERRAGVRPK
jgi:hypothetical protein